MRSAGYRPEGRARRTVIPLPILKTDANKLIHIRQQAKDQASLFLVDVTDAAQTTTNYVDYANKLLHPPRGRLAYLGIAVLGPRKRVSRLTGSLPLYRSCRCRARRSGRQSKNEREKVIRRPHTHIADIMMWRAPRIGIDLP